MKKLARKWKISADSEDQLSLPTTDDSRPIETHEQEEMVRQFEKSQAQQSRLWRSVFAVLLVCFGGFLVYSIFQQVSSPWELRYHAYFMEEVDSLMIIFADLVAVLVCLLATVGILRDTKNHRRWIWSSFVTSVLLAVFWLYYMFRLPRFRWDVIWLPFGPLSGAGISLYVDHLLDESSEEIRKLRAYMNGYDMEKF